MRSSKAATPIRSAISACTPRATGRSCACSFPRRGMSRQSANTANARRWSRSTNPAVRRSAAERLEKYQLRARFGDNVVELDDPYRFPPVLTDFDLHLLGEGTHQRIYDKLGAHPMTLDGVDGVAFVVLAPNARGVSVVGDFNFWNRRRHPMRLRGVGYLGALHSAGPHRRSLQVRHHRAERPASADEGRSVCLRRRGPAQDGLDRLR